MSRRNPQVDRSHRSVLPLHHQAARNMARSTKPQLTTPSIRQCNCPGLRPRCTSATPRELDGRLPCRKYGGKWDSTVRAPISTTVRRVRTPMRPPAAATTACECQQLRQKVYFLHSVRHHCVRPLQVHSHRRARATARPRPHPRGTALPQRSHQRRRRKAPPAAVHCVPFRIGRHHPAAARSPRSQRKASGPTMRRRPRHPAAVRA